MSAIFRFPTQRASMAVEDADGPMRSAMHRATESGWKFNPPETELTSEVLVLHLALDSNFWQCLAKAERWAAWQPHRQDYIEHLADGGTAAAFFARLLR